MIQKNHSECVQELELPGPAHLALPVPGHQGVQEEDLTLPHQPPLSCPLTQRIQVRILIGPHPLSSTSALLSSHPEDPSKDLT